MPRKKKPKLEDVIDNTLSKIQQFLGRMTIRDYLFFSVFMFLVYFFYTKLKGYDFLWKAPFPFILWTLGALFGVRPESPDPDPIDWQLLALSMGAAWIVVNTDTDDIINASAKIGNMIGGLISTPTT